MIKVLIVDDSYIDLLTLSEQLNQHEDIQTRYTSHSESAFEMAREFKPDVVIIDYTMPGVSGIELRRKLYTDPATNNSKIIFISASDDAETQLHSFKVGCLDFIAKPVKADKLIDAVLKACMLKRLDELKLHNREFVGKIS